MVADTVLDEVAFIITGRGQGLVFNGDDAQKVLVIIRSGMLDTDVHGFPLVVLPTAYIELAPRLMRPLSMWCFS